MSALPVPRLVLAWRFLVAYLRGCGLVGFGFIAGCLWTCLIFLLVSFGVDVAGLLSAIIEVRLG